MTSFAEFIAQDRERLRFRAADLSRELAEIEAELAAIAAYEKTKQERLERPVAKINGSGRYPYHDDGTLSVPEAGKQFLGLSASGSWLALKRGDLPAIKIGRYRRVRLAEMRRKMEERQAAQ